MTNIKWVLHRCFLTQSGPPVNNLEKVLDLLDLSTADFKNEVETMEHFIRSNFQPEHFCHNDIHFKNILQKNNSQIFLIDFDHADYGYRGYDLGYYFIHQFSYDLANFIVGKENVNLRNFMEGYVSITDDSLDGLRREISYFLPYLLLDHMIAKSPESYWAKIYKKVRPLISYYTYAK